MTGTSKALARLGVTGLGAVVMFAGLMPLTELAANAATYTPTNATSVSLSPDQDTAAVTTCNEFTATIAPSSTTTPGSVTVQISQATGATNGTSSGIRFCDPLATNPDSRGTVVASPTPGSAGTPGANTTVGATYCFTTTAPAAGSTSNVSCEAPFTDTNGDGKIVFGVLSTETGTMTVSAFGDTNGNGAQDVGENGDTSTKTWVSNTAANTDKINCSPTSATNDTGDTHTFTCSVTNANGVALSGQKVGFTVTSGPDAGVSYNPVTNTSTPASDVAHPGPGDATCNTTDNGASGTTVGQATCSFTNNGVPGTDSIRVYEDTNGVSGQQAGEPTTTISKTFATPPAPAPTTSSIAVTCSPNQTNTAGDTCQDDPRSDKTAKFTATVTNGVPAQPVAGVRVTFTLAQAAGNGALPNESTDTESLSSGTTTDKCITDAAGQCSTTLTDTNPQNDESFTVTASVPLNGGGTASDSATKNFHTPTAGEARNVSVAPKTDTKVPGSADTFTATVKDRFGNPVPGTTIDWSETGPGAFRTAAISCNTDAAGQCSIEVASLTGEQGTETVTATIHGSDASSECASPAGYSNYNANGASANSGTTPNAGGQNNVAPGAPAGNCSDSGTVTWKPATTPPPTTNPRAREFPVLNCWSPRKHVVVCRVYTRPRVQGADVVLRIVQKNGTTRIVRQKLTGERGRATFTFHHLKSGVVKRYVAHVRHTATTRAADTNHDKVRVK